MNETRRIAHDPFSPPSIPLVTASLWLMAALFSLPFSFAQAQVPPSDLGAVNVTSSLRPELHVDSGRSDTYLVVLQNSGPQDVQIAISQADFTVSETAAVETHPQDTLAASNAAWLEVASQVVVPAGGSTTVPVALEVPADASPGTYFSLVFLEPSDATSTEEAETQEGVTTSVTMKVRFGVAIITHVGEPANAELLFRDPNLSEGGDRGPSLAVTIENPDAFLASAEVWLELYDDSGALVQRVDADRTRIYPDSARQVDFDLGALLAASYQAVVIADAGDDQVYGVRYDLDLGSN